MHFVHFHIKCLILKTMSCGIPRRRPLPRHEDGGHFCQALGDLKFSPTPRGLSQMGCLKFSTFGGDNRVLSTEGYRESLPHWPKCLIPPTRKSLPSSLPPPNFYLPSPKVHSPSQLNLLFLLKIFFQSSIMTSKIHWSIKWTVI